MTSLQSQPGEPGVVGPYLSITFWASMGGRRLQKLSPHSPPKLMGAVAGGNFNALATPQSRSWRSQRNDLRCTRHNQKVLRP